MDRDRAAFRLSIAAFAVSLASMGFYALQWHEARASRLSQADALKKTEEDQRISRRIAEMQVMAAERSNILTQRQQNPRLAKDESDMPMIVSYYRENETRNLHLLPLLDSSSTQEHARQAEPDLVVKFLSQNDRAITIRNEGKSTAYDLVSVNRGIYAESAGETFATTIPAGMETIMLAPGSTSALPVKNDLPAPANASDLFRKGDASYYIIGKVEYRDPFQRVRNGYWCYEFHLKRSVGKPEIESHVCHYEEAKSLPAFNRIERDEK